MHKIQLLDYESIRDIFPHEDCQKNLRDIALSPRSPKLKRTNQQPDIFYQTSMAGHKY
jgi:pyruvate-ferredoxin/flavodoxin oxidoreductase